MLEIFCKSNPSIFSKTILTRETIAAKFFSRFLYAMGLHWIYLLTNCQIYYSIKILQISTIKEQRDAMNYDSTNVKTVMDQFIIFVTRRIIKQK